MTSGRAYSKDQSAVNPLIKYLLFFINFVLCLVSIAVVALMVWLLVLKQKKVVDFGDFALDMACWLCLGGAIALVVSFFGWLGALREYLWALLVYRLLVGFFLLVQVALVVITFVLVYVPDARESLSIYPESSLGEAIVKYRDDPDMQDFIDGVQIELQCCGTSADDEGYLDWGRNQYFNCTKPIVGESCSVPFSCCIRVDGVLENLLCGNRMQDPDVSPEVRNAAIHTRGCFKAITDILQGNVLVVGAVTLGILLPQIFMLCLAGSLGDQIRIQMSKW